MAELQIERIVGQAPVQAWGTIGGVPFYFRARYDEWELAASADLDPVNVAVDQGARGGFYRTGPYDPDGTGFGAGYMPHDTAEQILRRCAEEFGESLAPST